jgi:hypothetical protein
MSAIGEVIASLKATLDQLRAAEAEAVAAGRAVEAQDLAASAVLTERRASRWRWSTG